MRIIKAKLQQFRNLEQVELAPGSGANVIVGGNAQGKTNLLEGIFAVAAGGSFRVSNEGVLVQKGADFARVEVSWGDDAGDMHTAEMIWIMENGFARKTVKLNGVVTPKGAVIRRMPVVLFSPEDIDLIRLSPHQRRRFLDLLITRFDAEYQQNFLDYWRVLRQRNQLLLMIKQGRSPESDLDIWDEKMSELGSRIVEKRRRIVEELELLAGRHYQEWLGGGRDILKLSYLPSLNFNTPKLYEAGLRGVRQLDIVRANTTKGIHRDDVMFVLNGSDMRTSASRGEFRSVVLSLKLAEGGMLKSKTGESPVYLLDDIFSELDAGRRKVVAEAVRDSQVFITSNDEGATQFFERPEIWEVKGGMFDKIALEAQK